MNKTRYISKIDIGRILAEMLHERNINNNESADNIFNLMEEIPVDDGRYLCNFSESNQKILNKYMYVLDAPLEWERFLCDMGPFPFDTKGYHTDKCRIIAAAINDIGIFSTNENTANVMFDALHEHVDYEIDEYIYNLDDAEQYDQCVQDWVNAFKMIISSIILFNEESVIMNFKDQLARYNNNIDKMIENMEDECSICPLVKLDDDMYLFFPSHYEGIPS